MFLFTDNLVVVAVIILSIIIFWFWQSYTHINEKMKRFESNSKYLESKHKEYNAEAKQKEKDSFNEMNRIRLEHENKIKDLRNYHNEIKNNELNELRNRMNDLAIKHQQILNDKTIEFEKTKSEIRTQLESNYNNQLKIKKEHLKAELEKMKENEIKIQAKTLQKTWIEENELSIRQDAIRRSSSVNMGKITEHLLPFHNNFPFNHKDVRFIGSPIDLLVFDGHSEGKENITVYFIEVKTGNSKLSSKQQNIKHAILEKRVKWEVLTPDGLAMKPNLELPFPTS
jgi:predicted Holliday junction resolvase-like endonuclease